MNENMVMRIMAGNAQTSKVRKAKRGPPTL
jgi:hypothetical protein